MNRLSILAAVALATAPACGQAQDAGYAFDHQGDPASRRARGRTTRRRAGRARSGTPRSARARSASSTSTQWTYRQVPLGEGSSPHGVVLGPDGKAWITDGGQNAIVRYDPASEAIDVWKLPEDSGYTNLNTGAFDKDGVHWFTGQTGIYGKVDAQPAACRSGRIPRAAAPTASTTRPTARSGTSRSPAAISPRSTAPTARSR